MIRAFLGVLLAVAGWGQGPAAVQPEDRSTVEGQIINAITGEPIKKADLILMLAKAPGTQYGAISDTGGKFIFRDIDPGKYWLSAKRAGFIRRAYNARGPNGAGKLLTLSAGDKLTRLVFKLTPQSVVSGRVVDEDGDPMAQVDVQAFQYGYVQGKKKLWPSNGTSTNDLGEYRIFGLRAGKYFLMATYRDDTMIGMRNISVAGSIRAVEQGYAPTYYPGVSDAANAGALILTPGTEIRGADIRLVKTRAVRIRGAVVSPNGLGNWGLAVALRPRTAGVPFSQLTSTTQDSQGHFEIEGVTPGSYALVVKFTNNGVQYSARQDIEVGNSNIDDVRITLAAPVALLAHVRAEGSASVQFNKIRVYLNSTLSLGGNYAAAADPDGNVKLTNLSPGEYRPGAIVPPGLYVKSIRYGDTDALESSIDLSGGPPEQLEIVLSPAGGEVDGSVANDKGEPSAGATVTLVPEGPRRASSMFFKSGTTDEQGHFTFKDIAPGEYTVYAWDDVQIGALQDPDFLKPFEDKGKKLKIEEKGRENVTLEMIPAASMSQQ